MAAMSMRSGKLVLVVGPSGAGKDTLLTRAREALSARDDIVFQRRVVTRPSSHWEDHDSLTEEEFADGCQRGAFVLSWRAHGLGYGIPQEAMALVGMGKVVVCNASRAVVADAKTGLACKIVYVTVPADVRARRLAARGREQVIAGRLQRDDAGNAEALADLVIHNMGTPDEGAAQLMTYLQGLIRVEPGTSK